MEITEQELKLVDYAKENLGFKNSDPKLLRFLGVSQARLNQIACSAKKKGLLVSRKETKGPGLSKTNVVFWSLPKNTNT